jgi:hypothetical protein
VLLTLTIQDINAVARCTADARGLLGLDGAAPDLADLELDIRVTSASPDDRVEAMLAAWRERCPIYLALLRPQSIALSTSTSGDGG